MGAARLEILGLSGSVAVARASIFDWHLPTLF